MFVGRLAGMVGFRTHTFTRIGSIMDKKQPGSTKLAGLLSVLFQNSSKNPQIFTCNKMRIKYNLYYLNIKTNLLNIFLLSLFLSVVGPVSISF